MGQPNIGKDCDMLNKRAIAALLKENQDEAEDFWEEAMDINPNHFDTKVNYEMYRWKYALISDDQLVDELEEIVFKNQHKGHSLHGIISIALGNKEMGLRILEQFNQQDESRLVEDPSENLRRKKARELAKDIYREAIQKKDDFF